MQSSEEAGHDLAFDGVPAMFGPPSAGPSVQRLVLGGHLRRLREKAQLTTDQAADVIRASHSKISRMERGRVSFKERDICDLLSLYGVADVTEREAAPGAGARGERAGLVAELLRHPAALA